MFRRISPFLYVLKLSFTEDFPIDNCTAISWEDWPFSDNQITYLRRIINIPLFFSISTDYLDRLFNKKKLLVFELMTNCRKLLHTKLESLHFTWLIFSIQSKMITWSSLICIFLTFEAIALLLHWNILKNSTKT